MKTKNTTIRDIAERCGVSVGTVSGVLNDRMYIRQEVKSRVFAAMRDLDYDPNRSRRGVQETARQAMGLVLPTENTLDYFYSRAVVGLKSELVKRDWNFMLYTFSEITRIAEGDMYPGKQNIHCNGLVFFCPDAAMEPVIRKVTEWGIRSAVIRRSVVIPDVPVVTDDPDACYRIALEHLYEKGCRKIAMHAWFARGNSSIFRVYDSFLESHGLDVPAGWEYSKRFSSKPGYRQFVENTFTGHDRPDAVFCDMDETAVCLVQYLQDMGVGVPGDVLVTGINDDKVARLVAPGITSVNVPVGRMVAAACGMLADAVMDGKQPAATVTVVENSLAVRGSTDRELARQPWQWLSGDLESF